MALKLKIILNAENYLFSHISASPSRSSTFNTILNLARAAWLSKGLFLFPKFFKNGLLRVSKIYNRFWLCKIGSICKCGQRSVFWRGVRIWAFLVYPHKRRLGLSKIVYRPTVKRDGRVERSGLLEAVNASPRTETKVLDPVYQSGQISSVKCYVEDETLSSSSQSRGSQRPNAKSFHVDCVRGGVSFFKG